MTVFFYFLKNYFSGLVSFSLSGIQFYPAFKLKKAQYLIAFVISRCCKRSKKVFEQVDRAFGFKHQNSFKSMVVKIDIHVLKIQGLILRTIIIEAENWQKIKNSQPQHKLYRFL